MLKNFRLVMVSLLIFMFVGMVGYSFSVYSTPITRVKGVSTTVSPNITIAPNSDSKKSTYFASNFQNDALFAPLTPTLAQPSGNAGQSATPNSNTSSTNNNYSNNNTNNNNSGNDVTPTPTSSDPAATPIPTPEATTTPEPIVTPAVTPSPTAGPTIVPTPALTDTPTPTSVPTIIPVPTLEIVPTILPPIL